MMHIKEIIKNNRLEIPIMIMVITLINSKTKTFSIKIIKKSKPFSQAIIMDFMIILTVK